MACLSYLIVELTVTPNFADLALTSLTWHARQNALSRLPTTIYGSIAMPRSSIVTGVALAKKSLFISRFKTPGHSAPLR